MKVKTINRILKKVIDDFAEVLPEHLGEMLKDDAIITGGAIVSMLLKEKVNDYDIYFKSMDTALVFANWFTNVTIHNQHESLEGGTMIVMDGRNKDILLKDAEERVRYVNPEYHEFLLGAEDTRLYGELLAIKSLHSDQIKMFNVNGYCKFVYTEEVLETLKYKPLFISPNAISLTNDIQLITRFVGVSDKIHENYDFIHATNYWTYNGGLVLNTEALSSIITKELKYTGSLYPVTSIIRSNKFIARGWTCNAGEMFKMIYQASSLDLDDPQVLEEQLIGIDIAYFAALIAAIRDVLARDKTKKVTDSWIFELIDKLFNSSIEDN